MKPTVELGVLLAAASSFGCYALPARTVPVQSEGVRLSVPGVYCTPPIVLVPLPGEDSRAGELGARLKIENATDHVATLDSKGVRVVVNSEVNGEVKDPWIFRRVYQVPPHSDRTVSVVVTSNSVRCNEAQTLTFEGGIFLDGKPIAVPPLQVTSNQQRIVEGFSFFVTSSRWGQ